MIRDFVYQIAESIEEFPDDWSFDDNEKLNYVNNKLSIYLYFSGRAGGLFLPAKIEFSIFEQILINRKINKLINVKIKPLLIETRKE